MTSTNSAKSKELRMEQRIPMRKTAAARPQISRPLDPTKMLTG